MARTRRLAALVGGLRIVPRDKRAAAKAVVAAMLGVTAFVVLLDGWLLRTHLPADYVAFYTGPLVPRMFVVCAFAATEEIKYRLLLMTGLVAMASLARIRLTAPWFVGIILVSQFANVGALVLADPLYASLRYWAVGSVWGWLYWRHGFLAALAGHGLCHLLMDPLLLAVLG